MVHLLRSDGWLSSESSHTSNSDKIWPLIVNINQQWSSSCILYLLLKLITLQCDHSTVYRSVFVCDFGFNFSFVSIFERQYKMINRIAIAHTHYAFIILAFVFAAPSFKHRKKCCGHTVQLLVVAIWHDIMKTKKKRSKNTYS